MSAHATLQSIIIGFLNAALWSENDNSTESGGEPFDSSYGWEDLAPDTIHAACVDCAEFLDLCEAAGVGDFGTLIIRRPDNDADGSAGHDFLLTRNGHGAGFWDGDWEDSADTILAGIAQSFPEFNLYLGDDGMIYTT